MSAKVNSNAGKDLGSVVTSMMVAGKLARFKGIKSQSGQKVGRKVATLTEAAKKVGNRKKSKVNVRPTFKQAAAAALEMHRVQHGTKRGKLGSQPMAPFRGGKGAPPAPSGIASKKMMQTGD